MQIIGEYAKEQMKRKVSQFILSEAGRAGYRNAFSMAALVTASSLAAMLLGIGRSSAQHGPLCESDADCPPDMPYCCPGAKDAQGNVLFYECWPDSPCPL
ncbi:hypothetical protein J7M22_14715 [Candidatus Poribacteria bacterium]|nr:hypothetical protein [Candidatus Poribacteria bacterium]